ncbi:uncharacterized protein BO97DRAFT_1651 [Aspergillus homomorphus CBS 101889]|uniref:Uncharacterized protein n=1 Tax=Aspergillus homomorphus (strain CBS 101889) TaxID=1450537 RepID=A0A395IAF7_ASPHC|nr:hypothetical protein BO97DRAFT_1651 [Aspergillus homomorphus CBS 101889]RAL17192.1 hypothetical protein BO97DRAFT_1651 [Aspergillus homomorphus CBS 101889]
MVVYLPWLSFLLCCYALSFFLLFFSFFTSQMASGSLSKALMTPLHSHSHMHFALFVVASVGSLAISVRVFFGSSFYTILGL